MVAPLAGAWIEIQQLTKLRFMRSVAPLAGAWIEIQQLTKLRFMRRRRSPRGSVD